MGWSLMGFLSQNAVGFLVTLARLRTDPHAIGFEQAHTRLPDPADLPGGHPSHETEVRNILGDDRAGGNSRPRADGHRRNAHSSRSDCGTLANRDPDRLPVV